MTDLGWPSKSQLIRSFVQECSKKNAIGHMANYVDPFDPKLSKILMLIEHRPSHLNKDLSFTFNNAISLRYIRRGKLMLKSQ